MSFVLLILIYGLYGAEEYPRSYYDTEQACLDDLVTVKAAQRDAGLDADFFCLDAKYYPQRSKE